MNLIDKLLKNQNGTNEYQKNLFDRNDIKNFLSTTPESAKEEIRKTAKEIIENKKLCESIAFSGGTADTIISEQCINSDTDTVFDLASTTKLFTSLALSILKESGVINDQDPLKKFCPQFIDESIKNLTIFDFATFQANLQTPGRIDDPEISTEEAENRLFRISQKERNESFLLHPYGDFGALILKYVIESASSTSFFDFIREKILQPAGMTRTFPFPADQNFASSDMEHRIIKGQCQIIRTEDGLPHDKKAAKLKRNSYDLTGHAGIFSCLSDLIKLSQALLSEKILSMESLIDIGTCSTKGVVNGKNGQYFGRLVYTKNPCIEQTEVPVYLSGTAFTSSGYCGTHLTLDAKNGLFYIVLGNRCFKRVTSIIPKEGETIEDYIDENNMVAWESGKRVSCSKYYVYQKDTLINALLKYLLITIGEETV